MSQYPPPPPSGPPPGPQFYPNAPYPVPPKKQNKLLWIVVGIVGGLIVLCGFGGIMAGVASSGSEMTETKKTANEVPAAQIEESQDPEPVDTDGDGVVD